MKKGKLFDRKMLRLLMTGVSLSAALLIGGCGSGGGGSDSYDTPAGTESAPVEGAVSNVLVDSATLASWIKNGQVASSASFDGKVVILDYGVYDMENPANSPKRIQGACRVHNNDLRSRRVEGVAEAFPMVATGEQMDAVIQRLGIDADTTIVFTTDSWIPEWVDDEFSMYFATRAYWMFRYWGFPKENLKLLNGGNDAFAAAYPELMTYDVPTPEASEFSVRDLEADLQGDLRLSIADMIGLVSELDANTDVVLDARPGPYAGAATSPAYTSSRGDKVVYDGHSEGVQTLGWSSLFKDPANGDYRFKSKDEIQALFEAKGWSMDKMTTVYCTSGYSATPLFFAVDTILGGKVRLYDGSWTQYGMYSDVAQAGGELPMGSAWATDQYLDLDGGYRYNIDYLPADPLPIEPMVVSDEAQAQPFSGDVDGTADINPSQMEIADALAAPAHASIMAAPVATATASPLISAATLQQWIDAGLVNAAAGERVVILDASYAASFEAGHIDGAQLLGIEAGNNENGMGRVDGVMLTANMLLTAEKMDALFQNHGIDANTTVVITTSEMGENYYPSRVYTNLRYWGFPKERIKVLNGYNHAFATKLVQGAEAAAGENFVTVADLAGVQLQLRATLSEVMDAARDMRGSAIDFRGDTNRTGVTPGLMNDQSDYVVFEGKLNNGKFYGRGNAVNADGTFQSAATISAEMLANDIDITDFTAAAPAITYCTSGYAASTGFFVMDAILDVPTMIYDGSWSQWGQMSANADKGGNLVGTDYDYSAWAVDNDTYMSSVKYNVDNTKNIESLNADADLLNLDPIADADAANQVENADEDYKNTTTSSGDSDSAPSAGDDGGYDGGC